ncbi:MAG: ABC transporter substrate-binding protein [Beijerinckiaceae bacterium]|nr:ABC transporter substrate-binding protein [Beijerinckiaceae bacterium]
MNRRRLLAGAAALCLSPAALAQPASPPLIGWLRTNAVEQPPGESLRRSLARHGLEEGRDYRLSLKNTGGDNALFPALARELAQERAAIVVAFGALAAQAVLAEAKDTPVVGTGDLVGFGLARSLPRPGGNVTGVNILANELDLKKFEILRELLPDARRAAFIYDASVTRDDVAPRSTAAKLGLALETYPVSNVSGLEVAFAQAAIGAPVLNVGNGPMIAQNRQLVVDQLRRHRLAGVCEWREMAEAGCLASYGFAYDDLVGLAADYAARILRGAKPADLPITAPTRLQLVINMKVARELGLTIPEAMLARADEVIE